MGVDSKEPDIGLVALVGVAVGVVSGATAGNEVDGTGGGLEVAPNVGDRREWDLSAEALETVLGAGDVDRDARPDMLGTLSIRLPRSIQSQIRPLSFLPGVRWSSGIVAMMRESLVEGESYDDCGEEMKGVTLRSR